jgi:YD repeat-containing protein
MPNNSEGDLFSNKHEYETQGQYGGNIAKQTWTAKNLAQNNETRAYTYSYDKFDRLKSSVYSGIGTENYSSQNISYDKNGNIKTFIRNGVLGTNFGAVDNLAYSYLGNKLLSVTDAITGNASTKDFRDNSTGIDYT